MTPADEGLKQQEKFNVFQNRPTDALLPCRFIKALFLRNNDANLSEITSGSCAGTCYPKISLINSTPFIRPLI
jgi:hypothetical protein